jgi:hypothetical protein
VTLTPTSTPWTKFAEVPVKPPLPPKVTVPAKEVAVSSLASSAVMVMPVLFAVRMRRPLPDLIRPVVPVLLLMMPEMVATDVFELE